MKKISCFRNKIIRGLITLLVVFSITNVRAENKKTLVFSTKIFYLVLSGNNIDKIDHLLFVIEQSLESSENQVYKATLFMKKANLIDKPSEKIKLFKQGKEILEKEIRENPQVIEFHFLRLIIQEQAPKMLKYNVNIQEDKAIIENNFPKIKAQLQNIILEYSKSSKILTTSQLQK